jgi:predicted DsbA family dithiol-disulfide isomerase
VYSGWITKKVQFFNKLLDSAYQRSNASRHDVLLDAAKRYRVDAEKIQRAVTEEFAAKRDKKTIKTKARKTAA